MGKRKILEGVVVSDRMHKTRVVLVKKRSFSPLYKKMVTRRKKYKIHDEENKAKVGDRVKIIESHPYSKEKHFKLLEILK
jgi:small subunit ribosomal protein S17